MIQRRTIRELVPTITQMASRPPKIQDVYFFSLFSLFPSFVSKHTKTPNQQSVENASCLPIHLLMTCRELWTAEKRKNNKKYSVGFVMDPGRSAGRTKPYSFIYFCPEYCFYCCYCFIIVIIILIVLSLLLLL